MWTPSLRARWVVVCLAFVQILAAQEICDNGVDDDGNGLTDLNDDVACPCTVLPPQTDLITNGSFENNTCCPTGVSLNPGSFLQCANGWMDYMTTSTAEYFGCNYMPPALPQPVPSGSAAAGFGAFTNWEATESFYEFLMNCLQSPMVPGQLYELELNVAATRTPMSIQTALEITYPVNFGPIDLTLYGLSSCPTSPYVFYDPIFGNALAATYCPLDLGWTELGHVTYNPTNAWQEVSFSFTPTFDVQAIMFGPACPIPSDYISTNTTWPYFFVDGFSLEPVELVVGSTGHPCTNDLVLTASPYDPPNTQYQWYLDGVALVGQTADTLHATALGLGGGTYAMRAIDANGTCTLAEEEVEVTTPLPLMSATPTTGCAPLNVVLTNLTDAALNGTVEWDLGDGSTAASNTVSHTYPDAGTYDILLRITSPAGCVKDSLFEDQITVHPKPQAAFSVDVTEACVDEPIQFSNTSQPMDTYSCSWSFGDGALSDECDVEHMFSGPGTYNILLRVTSAFGCTDDTLRSQFIEILPTPVPDFSFDTDLGCVPLLVRFHNETPGHEQLMASWDLGNGQNTTTSHAITTYDTPGTYSISLTMTNDLGCSATRSYLNAISAHGLPVVTFFVEPDTGCAPLDVSFTNTTDPGMIGGCVWDFGDGESSTQCGADHIYQRPGTYTVSLTVNSPVGCEGDTTLFHLVHVLPSPSSDFVLGPQPTDLHHPEITFGDNSSNDVIAWSWQFPSALDAHVNEASAVVTYPNDTAGTYPVQLVVFNEHGCSDTTWRNVVIDGVFTVFVPNSFTPNSDGVNDVFHPVVRDALSAGHDLRIFDRWGIEVFATTDPRSPWDGSVNGAPPKTDVYVWKLRVRNAVDGITREFVGHVSVLL